MEKVLEKENKQTSKFLKPDFSTKVGRDFLAFYLQTKFKQILAYDQKTEDPIVQSVHPKFLNKFFQQLKLLFLILYKPFVILSGFLVKQ